MDLNQVRLVYFLGVGGIGMSAIARYFLARGIKVMGYDKTETVLTKKLENEGMLISYTDSLLPLQEWVNIYSKEQVLAIYTPAIPKQHPHFGFILHQGISWFKRSQVLGMLSQNFRTLAIAGTHGKTTTSALLAHLLTHANIPCIAFLGGILINANSNFIDHPSSDAWMVVEADEFDRSFLTLFPAAAVITAIDPDHLDIYGNEASFKQGFEMFVQQINPDGLTLLNDKIVPFQKNSAVAYGLSNNSGYRATNISVNNARFYFDLVTPSEVLSNLSVALPGRHNIENAVAASALALYAGIQPNQLKDALFSFAGVQRRFEKVFEDENRTVIDDYAHHPTELMAAISAARELYPNQKLTVIFQPHLFSRTRDFMNGFATSLGMADHVFLLPIYPARELPIEGVTSYELAKLIPLQAVKVISHEEAVAFALKQHEGVLMILGAGDIDQVAAKIKEVLND